MTQQIWYVRNCSLFQRLSAEQLGGLEKRARMRAFPKKSPIYMPADTSDGVFLLVEGRVRLCTVTPDGKQAILAFIEPGEVFGELALIESGDREERAEAATDCTVVLLPADEVRRLMEGSAELTLGITKLIGFRRTRIERRLRHLLFRSNRDRLTHLLVELAEQYGRKTGEGVLIDIKLSHQELASIIGATRETVTALLGEMQAEELLRISRQRLVVRDLRQLAVQTEMPVPHVTDLSRSAAGAMQFRLGVATTPPRNKLP